MALDVIGSGFPRNGTMSLRAAFVKPGYAPNGPSSRLGRDFDAGSRFHGALNRAYVDDA